MSSLERQSTHLVLICDGRRTWRRKGPTRRFGEVKQLNRIVTNTVRNYHDGKYSWLLPLSSNICRGTAASEVFSKWLSTINRTGHPGVCRESETQDDVAVRCSNICSNIPPITWLTPYLFTVIYVDFVDLQPCLIDSFAVPVWHDTHQT